MAYNVNDCVELRWGGPDNSAEASTCKRHAPRTQRAKMTEYRAWFHEGAGRPAPSDQCMPAADDAGALRFTVPHCCHCPA